MGTLENTDVRIVHVASITKESSKNDSEQVQQRCHDVEHKLHHTEPKLEERPQKLEQMENHNDQDANSKYDDAAAYNPNRTIEPLNHLQNGQEKQQ